MFIIGIDPGAKGAIVVLSCTNTYNVTNVAMLDVGVQNEKDSNRYNRLQELFRFIASETFEKEHPQNIYVLKEKTNAMPKEGVKSARSFGWQSGFIDGLTSSIAVLASSAYGCSVTLEEVTPRNWQSEILGEQEVKPSKKEKKYQHFLKAIMLYPKLENQFKGSKGGIKDGRVDALLIAEFCRRTLKGSATIEKVKEDTTKQTLKALKKRTKRAKEYLENKQYKRKHHATELSRAKKKLKDIEKFLATTEKRYKVINGK